TGIGYLTAVLDRCFAFNTGVVTPLQRVESKPDPGLAIPFKGGDIVSMQRAGLGPGVHLRFDTGAGKVSQHDPLPPTDKLLFSGGHTLSSKVPAGAMSPIGCGFYLAGGGRYNEKYYSYRQIFFALFGVRAMINSAGQTAGAVEGTWQVSIDSLFIGGHSPGGRGSHSTHSSGVNFLHICRFWSSCMSVDEHSPADADLLNDVIDIDDDEQPKLTGKEASQHMLEMRRKIEDRLERRRLKEQLGFDDLSELDF